MDDGVAVHVGNSFYNLSKHMSALVFLHFQTFLLLNIVIQGFSLTKLHHQRHVLSCVDHLEKSHNVRVFYLGEDKDLLVQGILSLFIREVLFLVGFES